MSKRRHSSGEVPSERRGRLHVYLGAAPGVGKTHAMLARGRDLAEHGHDVVAGWVENHDRDDTAAGLLGLERIPPRTSAYRGASFEDLDLDGVLARQPDVALIDELAHTNVPGGRHEKRWQDVEELLAAGIDVVTNLNVQHIDGLAGTVTALTGVPTRETVPDAVVLAADTLEVIDVSPEELRDRLARGAVYRDEQADIALGAYFTSGNLAALRDLATRWLEHQQPAAGSGTHTEEPTSVAVSGPVIAALTGAPEGEYLIRRASQLARGSGARLIGVHVREPSGLAETESSWLGRQRRLLGELGGRYAEVAGVDVARAVLDLARTEHASHLVLGATRRSRRDELLHGSVINRAIRDANDVEVHVIPSFERPKGRDWTKAPFVGRPARVALPPKRRVLGWVLALLAPDAIAGTLVPFRSALGLVGALFCVLLAVVLAAVVGGPGPAGVATVVGFLAADFFFTVPYYSLRVDRLIDLVALIAFAVVAGVIGFLVEVLARQGVQVAGASAQAESLARLAGDSVASPDGGWADTTDSVRRTFALDAVAVLRRDGTDWQVDAVAGEPVPQNPADATLCAELPDGRLLALVGDVTSPANVSLLNAFVGALRLAAERVQLHRLAREPSVNVER